MICLVLLNSQLSWLFPLPCGAGSAVPSKWFNLSVIIIVSLLICPMMGCRHSLLRLSNIFNRTKAPISLIAFPLCGHAIRDRHFSPIAIFHVFYQVECTFSNISTCEHLPVGGTLPSAFCVKYKSFSAGTSICWSLLMKLTALLLGPCKVRNETETKRNETKRNKSKTKQIETKRNKSKQNETKQIETKRNKLYGKTLWTKISPFLATIVLIVYIISYCNNLYYMYILK